MKIEQAKQMANEALQKLIATLESGHSETLQTYLATMARFHNYSFGNSLLIAMQRPDATHVAGFHTWRKLGRRVRKGESGIVILAPMAYKPKKDELPEGAEGEQERHEFLRGFKAVYVFDASQTDGNELPEFATVTGDPKNSTDRLKGFLRERNIKLEYSDAIAPAKGVSLKGRIVLLPGQSPAEEFSVLVHETAHELLHSGKRRKETSQTVRETEAEAVAFVVCQAAELNTYSASADYIQLYNGDSETLQQSLEHIQKTATQIIGAIQ